MRWIFFTFGCLLLLSLGAVAFSFFKENEKRALKIFTFSAAVFPLPYFVLSIVPEWITPIWGLILIVGPLLVGVLLILPFNPNLSKIKWQNIPRFRVDERDIMFSRRRLQPGSERFEQYYRAHPEKKKKDAVWRKKPGLLSPQAKFYHPLYFTAAEASFDTVEILHEWVEANPANNQHTPNTTQMTTFLKDWLKRSGAHSVGVTLLKEYHWYSHRGRQEPYGGKIYPKHKFALAFTVEMNKEAVDSAPLAPTVLESADQYLRAGMLAVKTAIFIQKLGFEARAHIDGNYQVICPLVARDAGLGELGRMGLLMTPRLGPRVRIGVVTTNLPLLPDGYQPDGTVIDFCTRCKKCAENCPAAAIPFDERQEDQGVLRWKIDHEACFTYWTTVGTDCARCVKVCPYSHPNNFLHNMVRAIIKRNSLARYLALKADDLLYGRKPSILRPENLNVQ